MLLLFQLRCHGKVGRRLEHAIVVIDIVTVAAVIVVIIAVVVPVTTVLSTTIVVVVVITTSVHMDIWCIVVIERLMLCEVSNRLINLPELVQKGVINCTHLGGGIGILSWDSKRHVVVGNGVASIELNNSR